jgi:putative hydrolase of the HAD superfamily
VHPELLLFDLGGVLVDFSGPRDIAAFMRAPATPADILSRWATCPHTKEYQVGKISAEVWADRFVRDWDLDLAPDKFLAEFCSWSKGFFPGAKELLSTLRRRYRLAVLSNSNALHWKRNEELGIFQEFEFAVGSHEIGLCKPDPAAFQAVLEKAKVPPAAVVFFDDLPANVAGAKTCGIRARRVEGVGAVRECLIQLGLL